MRIVGMINLEEIILAALLHFLNRGWNCRLIVVFSVAVWLFFNTIVNCIVLVILLWCFVAGFCKNRNTKQKPGDVRGAVSKTSVAKCT